jgi:hypothetical protein
MIDVFERSGSKDRSEITSRGAKLEEMPGRTVDLLGNHHGVAPSVR